MQYNHGEYDERDISEYDFADIVSIVLYDTRVDSIEEAQQNLIGNWDLVCEAVKEFANNDVNIFMSPMGLDEVTKEKCCWDVFDAIKAGDYRTSK